MRWPPVIVLSLTLLGCAETPRAPPAAPASVALDLPEPPPLAVPRPATDQCGSDELTGLVGKPTTEIPIPLEPGRRRVVCETCPRSLDYVASRQTILFDAATGRVTSAGCG